MDNIQVTVQVGSLSAVPAEVVKIQVREQTETERRLKLALKVSRMEHTYSMAQKIGIWPA